MSEQIKILEKIKGDFKLDLKNRILDVTKDFLEENEIETFVMDDEFLTEVAKASLSKYREKDECV